MLIHFKLESKSSLTYFNAKFVSLTANTKIQQSDLFYLNDMDMVFTSNSVISKHQMIWFEEIFSLQVLTSSSSVEQFNKTIIKKNCIPINCYLKSKFIDLFYIR
jgi:hypothetical protein